ncbi:hypothetical protein RhiirC2_107288 [Rhizophagus irregularis]|uniref:Uncharacterized protein n=1 Tax=Rhizophagus irregularis TaxID=588596 RepID=A0A2N1MRP0_9GLOM|nr:hypothetical protein RhiirC2_107288 [Rhizophagus irregularis]
MLHETMYKLVEEYVRFSHISRNYFLDKVLPYLNYWIKDTIISEEVGEDSNKETVLYYLSHHQQDSALINHVHALKITYWIQEGHYIPKIIDNTTCKSKRNNSLQNSNNFISTVLSISTNILTVTTTKSSTKAQINHKQQQQQQQQQQPTIIYNASRLSI